MSDAKKDKRKNSREKGGDGESKSKSGKKKAPRSGLSQAATVEDPPPELPPLASKDDEDSPITSPRDPLPQPPAVELPKRRVAFGGVASEHEAAPQLTVIPPHMSEYLDSRPRQAAYFSPTTNHVRRAEYDPKMYKGEIFMLGIDNSSDGYDRVFEECANQMDKEIDLLVICTVVSMFKALGKMSITDAQMTSHLKRRCEKKFREYIALCDKHQIGHFTFVLGVSSKVGPKLCEIAREYDVDYLIIGHRDHRRNLTTPRNKGLGKIFNKSKSKRTKADSTDAPDAAEETPTDATDTTEPSSDYVLGTGGIELDPEATVPSDQLGQVARHVKESCHCDVIVVNKDSESLVAEEEEEAEDDSPSSSAPSKDKEEMDYHMEIAARELTDIW